MISPGGHTERFLSLSPPPHLPSVVHAFYLLSSRRVEQPHFPSSKMNPNLFTHIITKIVRTSHKFLSNLRSSPRSPHHRPEPRTVGIRNGPLFSLSLLSAYGDYPCPFPIPTVREGAKHAPEIFYFSSRSTCCRRTSGKSRFASCIEKEELQMGSLLVQEAPPIDSALLNASGNSTPRVHSYSVAAATASPAPIGLMASTGAGVNL